MAVSISVICLPQDRSYLPEGDEAIEERQYPFLNVSLSALPAQPLSAVTEPMPGTKITAAWPQARTSQQATVQSEDFGTKG